MNVVVDSNLFVAAETRPQEAATIRAHLRDWALAGASLHAPWLFRYEVANALTRLVAASALPIADADEAWTTIEQFGESIVFHDVSDGHRIMEIARALKRQNSYDAAYVALAEELRTDVWTVDGRLARNAEQTGLPVKLIAVS